MKSVTEFRNDLLKRKELLMSKEYDGNPGFTQATEDLATHLKVDASTVVVRGVRSHFGSGEFLIDAFVYDSAADKDKIEPKKKEKKKTTG